MTLEDLGKEKIIWKNTYYGGVYIFFTDTRKPDEEYPDVIRMDTIMFDEDGWTDSNDYITRDADVFKDGHEVQQYKFLSEMPPERAHFAVRILLSVPHPYP